MASSRLKGIIPCIVLYRNVTPALSWACSSRRSPVLLPYGSTSSSLLCTRAGQRLSRRYSTVSESSPDVSYEKLKQLLADKTSAVVIDVREPWELREYGQIPGAINVPLGQVDAALKLDPDEFKEKYGSYMPSQSDNIIFSCLAGVRSKKALETAVSLGYTKVQHYPGGWEEWVRNELINKKN
ncbi:thiosulfate sulfurtransferase/rhodanese-like domain-containing protein 3 [Amia ocellicauda]|uniref:thiosulfate sulfurtransferase/rhodanese-like domain-containing protein 3 n=1 Tax=Amia ocellicauda TaxID=2972642 RepID=UPI0034639BE9